MSAITEDDIVCTGTSSLKFLAEQNIHDDRLVGLGLQAFKDAISQNNNAMNLLDVRASVNNTRMLVGWHAAVRTCRLSRPLQTIYFLINEPVPFSISLGIGSRVDNITIPPSMRSLLVVTPSVDGQAGDICLHTDKSTNQAEDVTLSSVLPDGSRETSLLTQNGRVTAANPSNPSPPPAPSFVAIPPAVNPATVQGSGTSAFASPSPFPSVGDSSSPFSAPGSPTSTVIFSSISPISPSLISSPTPSPSGGASEVAVSPTDGGEDASVTQNDDSESACFPASAMVELEDGRRVTMGELRVGDRVSVGNGFSDVILFTHREATSRWSFLRISTSSRTSLSVSAGHYLYMHDGTLTTAESIQVGYILRAKGGVGTFVTGVEKICEVGLYNPQTMCGDIMVNGIVASTYTKTIHPILAHWILMTPVRWMFRWSSVWSDIVSAWFHNGCDALTNLLPSGPSSILL